MHHFDWNGVGDMQQLNVPFTASLTAKDDIGNTLTNFSGQLDISGQFGNTNASAILVSEFDTGTQDRIEFVNASAFPVDLTGWQIALYDSRYWPLPVATITLASNSISLPGDVFLLNREGKAPGVYPNLFTGTNVSWNNGALGNPVAIAILDRDLRVVDFVCAYDANPLALKQPTPIPATEWIGSPLPANTNAARTYHRVGSRDTQSSADWLIGAPSIGVAHSNLSLPFPVPNLLAVQPRTVTLSNGVWSGSLQVASAQSNIVLVAELKDGPRSVSKPFRVEAQNDLSLTIQPPNLVVGWGQNFASTWTVATPAWVSRKTLFSRIPFPRI